jgi:Holliday junction DNA helicase RuvA
MIAAVKGILEQKRSDSVVIGVGGISLRVFVPTNTLSVLPSVGQEMRLFTSLLVRQEDLSLYGFAMEEERRLFDMLIGVAGVGPKSAQGVLSILTAEEAALAIASGNADSLSRAPGVGKKTAQRIILELRGKLDKEWEAAAMADVETDQADAMMALLALGYSAQEARASLVEEGHSHLALEERVRRALQRLGG